MLLKFCGLRRQEDVTLAARLGATHCGFVFHAGSPRCVDAVTVSRLESGDMVRVGVFTGQDSDEIARIMRLARLDMAQLHADQSVDCARQLGAERVIRVLWPQRYGDTAALEVAAGQYADSCALYLLDAGLENAGRPAPAPSLAAGRGHVARQLPSGADGVPSGRRGLQFRRGRCAGAEGCPGHDGYGPPCRRNFPGCSGRSFQTGLTA